MAVLSVGIPENLPGIALPKEFEVEEQYCEYLLLYHCLYLQDHPGIDSSVPHAGKRPVVLSDKEFKVNIFLKFYSLSLLYKMHSDISPSVFMLC